MTTRVDCTNIIPDGEIPDGKIPDGEIPDEKTIEKIFKNYSLHAMEQLIKPLVIAGLLNKDENNNMLKIGEHPTMTNILYGHISIPDDNSTYIQYKPSHQFIYDLSDIILSNINLILKKHQQPMEKSDIIAEIKKVKILSDIDSNIIDPCIIKVFESMVANEYIKMVDTKYSKVIY
jgi:NAD+--asparagine ADP-ribosyltransferase